MRKIQLKREKGISMRYVGYGFFALGALGVWTIFNGYPPTGSVIYIVGTVLGMIVTSLAFEAA
jgi:hypothetical protein